MDPGLNFLASMNVWRLSEDSFRDRNANDRIKKRCNSYSYEYFRLLVPHHRQCQKNAHRKVRPFVLAVSYYSDANCSSLSTTTGRCVKVIRRATPASSTHNSEGLSTPTGLKKLVRQLAAPNSPSPGKPAPACGVRLHDHCYSG